MLHQPKETKPKKNLNKKKSTRDALPEASIASVLTTFKEHNFLKDSENIGITEDIM